MKSKLIVICGPTASGKSSCAVELAVRFNGEIVSADSMQIYKEMNIGTAKPDISERCGIAHHMFDVVSACEDYNVSRYVKDADACIDDILLRGKIPFLVGGTGLYIDSLVNNTDFTTIDNDFDYRDYLRKVAEFQGNETVYKMLFDIDPEAAQNLHPNDLKRVIRALEVIKVSGKSINELKRESVRDRKYDVCFIGIDFFERAHLYERINGRVKAMLEGGLIDECKDLRNMKLSSTARAAIGYHQIFDYLDGKISLEQAENDIAQKTRNYAKRQLTWFRKNREIHWLLADKLGGELIPKACDILNAEMIV